MQKNFITQNQLKKIVEYCNDGCLTWKVAQSRRVKIGDSVGCVSSRYLRTKIYGVSYSLHRLVWLYHKGYLPANGIDHINGNPLDNRIENLRECNQSENSQNRRLAKDNTSGHTGVSFHKSTGKWQANICIRKKQIYLGLYENYDCAVKAYNDAKATLHPYHPALP